ncbi:MAG: glycoside hydrolase family 16 protein [Balneolaceae bacterium]|nr:MAG: glycoside hydrolase family 16 protein [Balneolaceae bacterium]
MLKKIALLYVLGFCIFFGCTSTEDETPWQLVWNDEFDSEELDLNKWTFQYGTGEEQGLSGWGNYELQYYTDREENIFIKDGKLYIVALEEAYSGEDFTSARIKTRNKGDWKFGRIEARAKLPQGQGIWPAIWMLPTDEVHGGWPKSGEIDIMEQVGHEPETIHGTVHYGEDWPQNQENGASFTLSKGIFSDDFHIFAIEWEEDEIRWYVNDIHFHTVTPADLEPFNYPFNERFHLILNLAVGGNWPGDPDETTEFPQSLIIDYVRVYQIK